MAKEKIIGIDLGTSNSAASFLEAGRPKIIPSAEGASLYGKAFPSVISFTKDDQILFGYARLSACPEYAEFGNISETELKLLGSRVWKVPQENWVFCPEVEMKAI